MQFGTVVAHSGGPMIVHQLFRQKGYQDIVRDVDSSATRNGSLRRSLSSFDLTLFGIAAIIGAGIFSTIGNAAYYGGPSVILLFLFTGVCCTFSALCYAEFASALPIAGSAYTYTYATFGELLAWIIGWTLLMEYAISNIIVAISWSDYFTHLLSHYGWVVPNHFRLDFMTAYRGHELIHGLLQEGKTLADLSLLDLPIDSLRGFTAWQEAPRILGFPVICNLPVLVITFIITAITYVGIQESKKISNILVALKLGVILLIVGVGGFYVKPENWVPFSPNGAGGVLRGISSVFFAFIGFDAISTTAEECRDPQRDLPRAMLFSIFSCTCIYAVVALILTGMVNYRELAIGDPLAFAFGPKGANIPWISNLVSLVGVVALATVLLIYQLGQPRIWMAMSRDGLLPPIFSSIHKKYKTPWFSTILTGFFVAIPSLFMNLTDVADLTSIGTLFAFFTVCAGSLKIHRTDLGDRRRFRIPFISSRYLYPMLLMSLLAIKLYLTGTSMNLGVSFLITPNQFPILMISVMAVALSVVGFYKNLSLIPVLGMTSCGYLIAELGILNWIRFILWIGVGIFVYFIYGIKNSNLLKNKINRN
jgi:APA family basic amino acid/polyamine antiporter